MHQDEKQDFNPNDFLIDLNKYTIVKKISENRFSKFELVKNNEDSKYYILQTFRFYAQSSYYENIDQEEEINNFIYNLVKFNHSTFIRFYGFSKHDFEGEKNIFILVNYEENGTLFQLFKKNKKTISSLDFTNTTRQIILIGIARSMILLSKYNIINGNLQPENIFLDEHFYPHLTNFCTLKLNAYQSTIYSSPEFFETLKFDRKSDVYSYSLILYEMITSKKPFSELEKLSNFQKNKKIINNYRPTFSYFIKEKHQTLIENCWSSNPSERPTFEEIFYKLSYDEEYYLENVDKNKVIQYANSIQDDLKPYKIISVNYGEQILNKIINDVFDPSSFIIDKIIDYNHIEISIDSKLIENSFQINKPYEYFFPTVKFQFEESLQKIEIIEIQNLIDINTILFKIENENTKISFGFIDLIENSEIETKLNQKISFLKNCIKGINIKNIIKEPIIKIPTEKDIRNFLLNQSKENFIETDFFDKIDVEKIRKIIQIKINKNKTFAINQANLFKEAEKQIHHDIENNKFVMIIKNQSYYSNKYFDEYEKIKQKIPAENVVEFFVYHGTKIDNHQKILNEHFYDPNEFDSNNHHDKGYFGRGIYATDNMFYSLYFANDQHLLKNNQESNLILCRAIFNKKYFNNIHDLKQNGKSFQKEISQNFGINYAFVGSNKKYHPIIKEEANDHYLAAGEFVFPNKFQLIPIGSFTIKRPEYCIILNHNDKKLLSNKNTKVNVYSSDSIEKGLEFVEKKKFNKIKLITNNKKFIEETRKIIKSNFICLVFSNIINNSIEWSSKMENVLFTNDENDFHEFVELKMTNENILNFSQKLENKFQKKFNLNKNDLFKFPLLIIKPKK